MKIRHKGLEHNVTTDAPFIGARLCAITCHNNCPGCFNQHLITEAYQETEALELIQDIKQNILDAGIIFGGLEWTEQPEELVYLVKLALKADLKVMLYTHLSPLEFVQQFEILTHLPILVKHGGFDSAGNSRYSSTYDVTLASENQFIKSYGGM